MRNCLLALAFLVSASAVLFAPIAAEACYRYVTASCVQKTSYPKNSVCYADPDTDEPRIVWFISSPAYDNRDTSPRDIFFDEIEIQWNVTISGKQSNCYTDYDMADRAARSWAANVKRDGALVRRVWLN